MQATQDWAVKFKFPENQKQAIKNCFYIAPMFFLVLQGIWFYASVPTILCHGNMDYYLLAAKVLRITQPIIAWLILPFFAIDFRNRYKTMRKEKKEGLLNFITYYTQTGTCGQQCFTANCPFRKDCDYGLTTRDTAFRSEREKEFYERAVNIYVKKYGQEALVGELM